MNLRLQQLMKLHKLMGPETGGEGGSGGGGGSGSGEGSGEGAGEGSGEGGGSGEGEGAKGGEGGEGKGGEGKPKPSDAEAKLLKDVMKHKKAAADAATELTRIQGELKKFEGIDAEKVRALLKQQADAEEQQALARGEYDRLKKQMADAHAAEKTALQAQLEAKDGEANTLRRQIADMTVGQAFTASNLVKEELTLTPTKARVIYGSHFEFKDGNVVGFDKPAGASDRTMLVDAAGEALPFEDALRKLVEADPDKDQLFKSKVRAGAGSGSQSKGKKESEAAALQAKKSSIDKIAAGLKALAK
jgi:hypothetical protein